MCRFGATKVVRGLVLLGARQIFPNGARKFCEWRKIFLVVVGDSPHRGAADFVL